MSVSFFVLFFVLFLFFKKYCNSGYTIICRTQLTANGKHHLAQKATVPLRCGRITNSFWRNYFLKLKSSNVRFVAIVTCKKMH